MIYVPLTPVLGVLINSYASKTSQQNRFAPDMDIRNFATKEFVTEINQTVIKHSEQYVISNQKSQQTLELMRELKNWKYDCTTAEIPTENGQFIINNLGVTLQ